MVEVLCRPAREADTADMLELTSTIWDGNDYVPHLWAEWLADPNGLLVVAELQGRVIGLSKLSQIGADEWWLQGLRVHPEYQGRGVAARLHDYVLKYWQLHGNGVMRLATSAQRVQVHHLCGRSGFTKVGEYASYSAPVLPEVADRFHLVEAQQAQVALDFVLGSELFTLSHGLMDLGWEWCRPDAARLAAATQEGRAWWWQSAESAARLLLVTGLDDDENGIFLVLQLVAGAPGELPACLGDYRRLTARLGYPKAAWVAPCQPAILAALEQAGFQRDWDNNLYIFEKGHASNSAGGASPQSPRMV